jgi:membrane-associated protease RseP (regulator of RpoE activity)
MKSPLNCLFVSLFVLMFSAVTIVAPVTAQPGRHFGHSVHPPYPHHYHHNDFDRALGVIGAVGAVAAIANGYSPYVYHRYAPSVVVVPPRPTVVIERSVVVEQPVVVKKTVLFEKTQQQYPADYFSPKLGATFIIQNMTIPGYTFTATRLTSDPIKGSPLDAVGLRKGDVITRLDNEPVNSFEELERHEKTTQMRYIKTGTTKVLLAKIYIPTNSELNREEEKTFYAP